MQCHIALPSRMISLGWLLRLFCNWWRIFVFLNYIDALLWMNMFILVLWCSAWGKWLIQRCALLSPAPLIEIFVWCVWHFDLDIFRLFSCLFFCFPQLNMMSPLAATDHEHYYTIRPGSSSAISSNWCWRNICKKAGCIENMGPHSSQPQLPMQTSFFFF